MAGGRGLPGDEVARPAGALPGGRRWRDDELVLISALEHWSYCPRQCALIHLEQTYDENLFTLRGNRVHERVHDEGMATAGGVRAVRGVPLFSARLGLTGKSDLVEWHGAAGGSGGAPWVGVSPGASTTAGARPAAGAAPAGTPYPVEYKAGPHHKWGHEALQLCAQAVCLEEMLGMAVPAGAIYSAKSKRRREIVFTADDRARVAEATAAVRAMLAGDRLPLAVNDPRCPNCSLIDACLPAVSASPAVVRGHWAELFHPRE